MNNRESEPLAPWKSDTSQNLIAPNGIENQMLTPGVIREVERTENQHHKRIHAAVACRHQGKKGYQAWQEATSAWHAQRYPTDYLWSDEFMVKLRGSEPDAVEDAIVFLEVDPWYFRSGYLKERLIRGLKAATLTNREVLRLQNVIWNVAAGKNRREFSNYCSLAISIATDDFNRRLANVSPEADRMAFGKFGYLRSHLERHFSQCKAVSN